MLNSLHHCWRTFIVKCQVLYTFVIDSVSLWSIQLPRNNFLKKWMWHVWKLQVWCHYDVIVNCLLTKIFSSLLLHVLCKSNSEFQLVLASSICEMNYGSNLHTVEVSIFLNMYSEVDAEQNYLQMCCEYATKSINLSSGQQCGNI